MCGLSATYSIFGNTYGGFLKWGYFKSSKFEHIPSGKLT